MKGQAQVNVVSHVHAQVESQEGLVLLLIVVIRRRRFHIMFTFVGIMTVMGTVQQVQLLKRRPFLRTGVLA